ncbi:hypothetical protein R84B8_01203 [Treponema sp. R8-4-B8]
MDINEISEISYPLLIKNLPSIVSSFSLSINYSKGKLHRWNRMRNKKVIMNALIPKEVENYIIERIKNMNEFIESKVNIVTLIKTIWYISYIPFENAIIELINDYLNIIKNKIEKDVIIIFDNLMRKAERPFNTFFAGDLAWLLAIYLNTFIMNSKLFTYRNRNMESNFPQNQCFPFHNYCKQIFEINDFDIFKDIINYTENDYILYITKTMWKPYDIDKLEGIVKKKYNLNQKIIVWELKPHKIMPLEKYRIHFIQGFSEKNLTIIEDIIRGTE